MAIARDGLLPPLFPAVNHHTQTPYEHNFDWDMCCYPRFFHGCLPIGRDGNMLVVVLKW
jgi:hypothetical protein